MREREGGGGRGKEREGTDDGKEGEFGKKIEGET